jgi:hypothetical protein
MTQKASQEREPLVPEDSMDPKRKIVGKVYNMQDFSEECVTVFCNLSGYDKQKLKPALTPFLDESKDPVSVIAGEPELKEAGGAAKKKAKAKAKGESRATSAKASDEN